MEESTKRVSMDVRKKLFLESVVRQWNRLPRKVGESLSLEVLKESVDVLLRVVI